MTSQSDLDKLKKAYIMKLNAIFQKYQGHSKSKKGGQTAGDFMAELEVGSGPLRVGRGVLSVGHGSKKKRTINPKMKARNECVSMLMKGQKLNMKKAQALIKKIMENYGADIFKARDMIKGMK